jgi:hypothetical protein
LDFVIEGGEVIETREEIVAELPFDEAALAPLGDVLLVDGLSVEGGAAEGFFDLRERVEPMGDVAARLVAIEAEVDFVTEGGGETGDFAGTRHRI